MNRRDFLFFRRTRHARIIEIPCERIYMHHLNASLTESRGQDDPDDEPIAGEPRPAFAERTTKDVLETLESQLKDVELVRVIDRHWLASDTLSREFDAFLAAFVARGGRVEFVDGAAANDSRSQNRPATEQRSTE